MLGGPAAAMSTEVAIGILAAFIALFGVFLAILARMVSTCERLADDAQSHADSAEKHADRAKQGRESVERCLAELDVLVQFHAVDYKRLLRILEEGFTQLANIAYSLREAVAAASLEPHIAASIQASLTVLINRLMRSKGDVLHMGHLVVVRVGPPEEVERSAYYLLQHGGREDAEVIGNRAMRGDLPDGIRLALERIAGQLASDDNGSSQSLREIVSDD